jgi:hypothetical protein
MANLRTIDNITPAHRPGPVWRWLLPISWALAAVGYFGPWIAHPTAALTITGVDMAEFVKFVPGVAEGSLSVFRELFYLPPVAVVVSVAILIGSWQLGYPWPFQALVLGLAIPLSLQVLPPAWSPGTLLTAEFRLQTSALGLCWLLLASFWLLARLPMALRNGMSAIAGLGAVTLPVWQFISLKPAVDAVYGSPVSFGWGLFTCLGGLTLMAATSLALFLVSRQTRTGPWTA